MSHLKSFVNCLPLFLVFGLISWIYISYTVVFCFYYVDSPLKRCSYVTATQILAVLFLWSFYESICQNHDAIPTQYKLTNGNSIQINHNDQQFDSILRKIIETRRLKIVTRSDFGTIRYCRQCKLIKPDRTHHCSICKICVLKMDHHCPWLRNCIGHLNQKQFVLMLLYGAVICGFFIGTILEFLLNNWINIQEFTIIIIGFTTACLMGIIGLLLFVYNLLTIIRNQTTIESLHATVFEPDYLTFDLGAFENFSYVFGDKIAMWPIPITTASGNGYEFPSRMI